MGLNDVLLFLRQVQNSGDDSATGSDLPPITNPIFTNDDGNHPIVDSTRSAEGDNEPTRTGPTEQNPETTFVAEPVPGVGPPTTPAGGETGDDGDGDGDGNGDGEGAGEPDSGGGQPDATPTLIGGDPETAAPTTAFPSIVTENGNETPSITSIGTASTGEPTDVDMAAGSSSGSGSDSKRVAAIAVPVIVVCLLLIGGIFFFLYRRRKRQSALASASGSHIETNNGGMTQNNMSTEPVVTPLPRLIPPPSNAVPTMRYSAPEATRPSPQEPPQGDINNHRLSAIPVQLPRAQQPTVVTTRPQSHIKRNSVQQGSTALTEENLANLGDTPQGYGYQRPRSPFEHPDDDAVSAISGLSPTGHAGNMGRDADEVSAVSSLEPSVPPRNRQPDGTG